MLSTGLHGVLLLGAALMAIDSYGLDDGEGSGFSCRMGDPTPSFDRIERAPEHFAAQIPREEGSALIEPYVPADVYGVGGERWSSCCECGCGGAATALAAWPRDIANYFDRKLSVATSRRGVRSLKTHSRRCAFQDTGLEADCNCGLIPRPH